MYIYTYKYILFLGDVEQKQIYQTSWKREGRRMAIQHPELPRLSRLFSVPPARSRLFEDATSRSARTQHPRKGVSSSSLPPPPRPRPIRAPGEGCSGQGCRVARRQQRPRVPSVPPPTSLPPWSSPRDRAALLPALPAQLNSRGQRRAAQPRSMGTGLPATAQLPAAPRAIASFKVRSRKAVNE